jgi:hypothetical protein
LVRTTLTLDDDVAERLRELARQKRAPFRKVLNDTLRRGLSAPEPRGSRARPFKVVPFESPFRAGVDPLKLNQLVDELDARAALDNLRR